MAVWYGLWSFGINLWPFGMACSHMVYFSQFGIIGLRKIWQPWFPPRFMRPNLERSEGTSLPVHRRENWAACALAEKRSSGKRKKGKIFGGGKKIVPQFNFGYPIRSDSRILRLFSPTALISRLVLITRCCTVNCRVARSVYFSNQKYKFG
jgi:hypothetical protein